MPISRQQAREFWSSPSAFMHRVYGLKPFPYQAEFLNDESDRIVWVSGRQIGKSTALAVRALLRCLTRPGWQVLMASRTLKQAKFLMEHVREGAHHPLVSDKVVSENATSMRWWNGSGIQVLAVGHQGITSRGFTPNEIDFDEAAFMPKAVYTALRPSLATVDPLYGARQLCLTSTPWGKQGQFYEATKQPFFSVHRNTALDCPLITQDFLAQEKLWMTDAEYRQEYLGEFVIEGDTFFSADLIESCIKAEIRPLSEPQAHLHHFLGVDPAEYGSDDAVFVVIVADDDGNCQVAHIEHTNKLPLTDTMGRILSLHNKWHFDRIFVDETGLGSGVRAVAVEQRLPVKGVTFTQDEKESMFVNLKRLMENGKLVMFDHFKMRYQLVEMQYQYTSNGHLKLEHPVDGHDDFPCALALACSAASRPKRRPFIA